MLMHTSRLTVSCSLLRVGFKSTYGLINAKVLPDFFPPSKAARLVLERMFENIPAVPQKNHNKCLIFSLFLSKMNKMLEFLGL